MKNIFSLLAFVSLCTLLACTAKETPRTAPALSLGEVVLNEKRCITDDKCAEMTLKYPVLKGGDSLITKALNDSIQLYVRSATQVFRENILKEPLDSTVAAFFRAFVQSSKEMESLGGWSIDVEGK